MTGDGISVVGDCSATAGAADVNAITGASDGGALSGADALAFSTRQQSRSICAVRGFWQ